MGQIQEFPKWKYHFSLAPRLVNDPEQETGLGSDWADHPDHVSVPEPVREPETEVETYNEDFDPRPRRRSR